MCVYQLQISVVGGAYAYAHGARSFVICQNIGTNKPKSRIGRRLFSNKEKHKTQYNCKYCSGVHATVICTMNLELLGKQSAC